MRSATVPRQSCAVPPLAEDLDGNASAKPTPEGGRPRELVPCAALACPLQTYYRDTDRSSATATMLRSMRRWTRCAVPTPRAARVGAEQPRRAGAGRGRARRRAGSCARGARRRRAGRPARRSSAGSQPARPDRAGRGAGRHDRARRHRFELARRPRASRSPQSPDQASPLRMNRRTVASESLKAGLARPRRTTSPVRSSTIDRIACGSSSSGWMSRSARSRSPASLVQ